MPARIKGVAKLSSTVPMSLRPSPFSISVRQFRTRRGGKVQRKDRALIPNIKRLVFVSELWTRQMSYSRHDHEANGPVLMLCLAE